MYQAYKTKTASLTENTASILKRKRNPHKILPVHMYHYKTYVHTHVHCRQDPNTLYNMNYMNVVERDI